jgi:hypothetical protein
MFFTKNENEIKTKMIDGKTKNESLNENSTASHLHIYTCTLPAYICGAVVGASGTLYGLSCTKSPV